MKKLFTLIALIASVTFIYNSCSDSTSPTTGSEGEQTGSDTDSGTTHEGPYPVGVSVTEFSDDLGGGSICSGYIAKVDFNANPRLRFNVGYEGFKLTPTEFFQRFNLTKTKGTPYIVINGGYFSGNASVSLAIIASSLRCHNIMAINWPNDENAQCTVYPVRSCFGQMSDGSFEAQWAYCVRQSFQEYYSFTSALGNNEKTETFMTEAPDTETPGGKLWQPVEAIGGGPRLVCDGKNVAVENYWAEVFDSGGTAGLSRQPRTAIGVTPDNVLIMIVCDGRKMNGSSGFTLSELADKFISLGACDAINLDGGGSSAIVGYEGTVLNRPSDSGTGSSIVERKVLSAVVITEVESD